MKSVLLFAQRETLVQDAVRLVVNSGGIRVGIDGAQLRDVDGGLLYLYQVSSDEIYSMLEDEPLQDDGADMPPSIDQFTGCLVECRSEEFVTQTLEAIASSVNYSTWVQDSAGVIWNARYIDANRVTL